MGHVAVLRQASARTRRTAVTAQVILYPESHPHRRPGSRQSASGSSPLPHEPNARARQQAAPQQAGDHRRRHGRRNSLLRSAPNERASLYSAAAPIRCAPLSTRRGGRSGSCYPVLRASIFALDATASRQPTWDLACQLQGQMFQAAAAVGELSVQLAYFRGEEFRTSAFVPRADMLTRLMSEITCKSGHTQIGRVLSHVQREASRLRHRGARLRR